MTYHVSSSIELRTASNGTNSDIFNELICTDGMDKSHYTTYVQDIVHI